ncbi:hypothetical protein BDM02DRAFT_3116614 [Thelephora ganbajun]|uniref:Uncharacterized protein n=1 Tax=Thelephora ganbajun TaxID=370292 RepID=A0ACB6ZDE9_THEGA|nr:hypothetical protein BDM02DRAFT_3116614 [Thelephora ganbajun]
MRPYFTPPAIHSLTACSLLADRIIRLQHLFTVPNLRWTRAIANSGDVCMCFRVVRCLTLVLYTELFERHSRQSMFIHHDPLSIINSVESNQPL